MTARKSAMIWPRGRPTLPFIHALKHSDKGERRTLRRALAASERGMAAQVADIIERSGGIDYTHRRARSSASQARAALGGRCAHLSAGPGGTGGVCGGKGLLTAPAAGGGGAQQRFAGAGQRR